MWYVQPGQRWRTNWRRMLLSACLVYVAWLCPMAAYGHTPTPDELRRLAEQAEQRGDWVQACAYYEQLPARERNLAAVRKRYLACVRHAERLRRYRDPSYHQQTLQLSLTHALAIYEEVVGKLHGLYADKPRVELALLFKHGLDELTLALNDPDFCRAYVTAGMDAPREFQAQLAVQWMDRKFSRPREAAQDVGLLAQSAEEALGLPPVVVVLEMASGACGALDEYTAYLSPRRFQELNATLKGEVIGIGIEVVMGDQRLVISQVLAGSPAQIAGLKNGDYLLRLAGKLAVELTAETAAELLAGELGTFVELEVQARGEQEPRQLMLPRQSVRVPSVSAGRFVGADGAGIAFLQITAFHESTPRELDEALRDLHMAGMKALVLDLRGNPGGLFPAALAVVKRFVTGGVIASTRGQIRDFNNRKYEANEPSVLTVPLVVLVDNGTASMAEMVAGALKDNHRATLVGEATFGKGVLQRIHPLTSNTSAGIQVTVARLFSPRGHAYQGTGVTPHTTVSRTPSESALDMAEDMQLTTAIEVARGLVVSR